MDLEEWLEVNAARAARALANPAVRAEVLELMSSDEPEAKQRRRQEEAKRELSTMEWRWRYSDSEAGDADEAADGVAP